MTKKQQATLDAQLDHWEATDTQHTANMKQREIDTAHDFDHFDHKAYLRMLRDGGWNR